MHVSELFRNFTARMPFSTVEYSFRDSGTRAMSNVSTYVNTNKKQNNCLADVVYIPHTE